MRPPTKMKICFFNSDPKWGGGVTFFEDHTVGMQKLGHDIIAICSPNSMLSQFYRQHDIPQWKMAVSRMSFINPIKILKLIRFYKKEKIDAVVFTTSEDLKIGGIAAKLAGVPKIIYRRGLAVPIKNRATNRLLFSKVITHLIANSEETKRTILHHLSDITNSEDIMVIYNGLDISARSKNVDHIITASRTGKEHVFIGNAGRLSGEKGQIQLIPIAKALKERGLSFTIFIAGTGDQEEPIRQAILKNQLSEQIKLVGYVDEIERFMTSIDLFVLTSHWEGFGYVMVEAMLQKKPVVAYDVSSMPEVVKDKETGLLAKYKDINDFADKVEHLIRNKELRHQMGETGYQMASHTFDLKEQIKKFDNYIKT